MASPTEGRAHGGSRRRGGQWAREDEGKRSGKGRREGQRQGRAAGSGGRGSGTARGPERVGEGGGTERGVGEGGGRERGSGRRRVWGSRTRFELRPFEEGDRSRGGDQEKHRKVEREGSYSSRASRLRRPLLPIAVLAVRPCCWPSSQCELHELTKPANARSSRRRAGCSCTALRSRHPMMQLPSARSSFAPLLESGPPRCRIMTRCLRATSRACRAAVRCTRADALGRRWPTLMHAG